MNPHQLTGQQLLTSFHAACGALFAYKREIAMVSSVVRAVMRMTNICLQGQGHRVNITSDLSHQHYSPVRPD